LQIADTQQRELAQLRALSPDRAAAVKQLWRDFVANIDDTGVNFLAKFAVGAIVNDEFTLPEGITVADTDPHVVAIAWIEAVAHGKDPTDVTQRVLARVYSELVYVAQFTNYNGSPYTELRSRRSDLFVNSDDPANNPWDLTAEIVKIAIEEARRYVSDTAVIGVQVSEQEQNSFRTAFDPPPKPRPLAIVGVQLPMSTTNSFANQYTTPQRAPAPRPVVAVPAPSTAVHPAAATVAGLTIAGVLSGVAWGVGKALGWI